MPHADSSKIPTVWVRRILYRKGNYSDNHLQMHYGTNLINCDLHLRRNIETFLAPPKKFYIFFISKDEVKMVFKPFSLIIFFMFVKKNLKKLKKSFPRGHVMLEKER